MLRMLLDIARDEWAGRYYPQRAVSSIVECGGRKFASDPAAAKLWRDFGVRENYLADVRQLVLDKSHVTINQRFKAVGRFIILDLNSVSILLHPLSFGCRPIGFEIIAGAYFIRFPAPSGISRPPWPLSGCAPALLDVPIRVRSQS